MRVRMTETVNGTEYEIRETEYNCIKVEKVDNGPRIAILDMEGANYGQKQEAKDKFEQAHVRRQASIPLEDLEEIFIPRAVASQI